jgi:hypothetical protein
MDEKSSVVPSSIYCNFCFLRFLFLAPTSLSCFRLGINSFVTMLPFSLGISILDGAFAARILDLTTFLLLVKTFGN